MCDKKSIIQAKWWERLLLRFKFKHYLLENGFVIVYKLLLGRMYILSEIPRVTTEERIRLLERQVFK
jgi:hypothetical protein